MKVLIAIPSCHVLRHYEQAIRDTWGKEVPPEVDLRFFLGQPKVAVGLDEVHLDCGDTLSELTTKCVSMFRWALEQSYEYVWKFDLDTFVRPHLLPAEPQDWVGGQNCHFASGGAGYGLSKCAMEIVVNWPITQTCAEDLHNAEALLHSGIKLHNDPHFKFMPGTPLDPEAVTYHLSSVRAWDAKYQPQWMYEAYSARGMYWPLGAPEKRSVRFRRLR